jgi:hypothetical protein
MRFSLGRAFDFSHFGLGAAAADQAQDDLRAIRGAAARAAADDGDDERKRRDGESDEDYDARMKKLDEKEAANSGAQQASCDDDEEDDDAASDKDDPQANFAERLMRAERRGQRKGRRMERTRCGTIFANPAAARNVKLASKLAFSTGMEANAAVALLEESPAAGRGGLTERMAKAPKTAVPPGNNNEKPASSRAADGWDRAFAKYAPTKS